MRLVVFAVVALLSAAAAAQGSLAMYCSSPSTAWCQGMAIGFEKATGVKVTVTQKATGELYAQVRAEAGNPRGDVWWAGPGDAFLQAAEEGLGKTNRPPTLNHLGGGGRGGGPSPKPRAGGFKGEPRPPA